MRLNLRSRTIAPIAAPHHFPPPTKRELRAQAVHRLQVGIFGICAMLLIVGLANIIMNRARLAEAANPTELSVTEADKGKVKMNDPLADIGVVPAADATATPASKAH